MGKYKTFLATSLLSILTLYSALCFASTPLEGQNIAILIGVNDYNDRSNISNLSYAKRDMIELEKVFKQSGYKTIPLYDDLADKQIILNQISMLKSKYSDGNNLIFAFSGHGYSLDQTNYLALKQTQFNQLTSTGLSVQKIIEELNKTNFSKKILFIDACRNKPDLQKKITSKNFGPKIAEFSPSRKDLVPVGLRVKNANNQGVRILYSTDSDDYSYEDGQLGHGVFTYFLIKELKGIHEGVFFEDLLINVSKKVRDWVQNKYSSRQIPFQDGASTGRFLIIPPKKPAAPPAKKPISKQQSIKNEVAYQRANSLLRRKRTGEACQILSRIKQVRRDADIKFNKYCN